MRFDLAQGIETPEGRSWPYEAGSKGVSSPYLDRGTAGVGAALLRFIYLAKVNEFKQDFLMLYTDCIRKYTFGTGMARIAAFLARLIDKRPADFMLDDYYPHFS